jgi:hypothetical protein
MTFDELLEIIPKVQKGLSSGKTNRQIAADLEAEFSAGKAEAKARKPRQPKAKEPSPDLLNGVDTHG